MQQTVDSNNGITSDKWTQLYKDIAGIKFEFISLKNFVMGEIRDMKSFNKSNFEPEVNNSLFDPNGSLIGSQNEEIRVLIIKNIKDQNFSYKSDFSNFNNS